MSVTLQRVGCGCRFLIRTLQCTNVINTRHLPRWTHRQPVGIIGNEISKEEKENWKLNVEREVGKSTSPFSDIVDCNELPNKTQTDMGVLNRSQGVKEKPTKRLNKATEFFFRNVHKNSEVDSFKEPNEILADADFKDRSISKEHRTQLSSKTFKKTGTSNKLSRKKKSKPQSDQKLKLSNAAMKLEVPQFIDLEKDDRILSQYMTNVKSQKRREKVGKILLEGKRLIKDAVCAGILPEAVFFSRIKDLKYLDLPQTSGVKIYKLTYKEMCDWSDVSTPQGVLAIVKTPDISKIKSRFLPLTVICDNVRDPGNMGTIIRTCAGIGCQQIILTKGCVDLWEPKVLRSAAGGHFRVSVKKNVNWSEMRSHIPVKCQAFIAENNSPSKSEAVQSPSSEENNVETIPQTFVENTDDKCSAHSDVPSALKEDSNLSLPLVPYYSCNFTGSSLVLIVGGETEGVSSHAYHLVSSTNGVRLNVPLSNKVESLNVGVALGIIGFEMKRQFIVKSNTCPDTETLGDSQVAMC